MVLHFITFGPMLCCCTQMKGRRTKMHRQASKHILNLPHRKNNTGSVCFFSHSLVLVLSLFISVLEIDQERNR